MLGRVNVYSNFINNKETSIINALLIVSIKDR